MRLLPIKIKAYIHNWIDVDRDYNYKLKAIIVVAELGGEDKWHLQCKFIALARNVGKDASNYLT